MKKYWSKYGNKNILAVFIAADLLAMYVCGSVLAAGVGIDTSYDGRKTGFVSPVKNQLNYGSCWTFGMLATVEVNWNKQRQAAIKAGKINEAVAKADFSERYLAWLGYNAPLGTDASTYLHPFYPSFIDPDRGFMMPMIRAVWNLRQQRC